MVMRTVPVWPILVILFFFSSPLDAATGQKAMVVTADPHATQAALDVLKQGGNAADAAIAAQWVLNVVEPQSSGLGGGGFLLYYEADTKRLYAFDGRETAPAAAFPEMFFDKRGKPYPFKPDRVTGGLPVGVPGTLKLLETVYGRLASKKISFADLFNPAVELAENGFPVSKRLAFYIDQEKHRLKRFPDSRRIFLDAKNRPLRAGALLRQPDLAETFRLIQKKGARVFYEGKLAEEIAGAVEKAPFHPGLMKKEDLASYRVVERGPVRGSYRGYDIFSVGPPSSGGTTLIEALHILENYDLALLGHTPNGIHVLIEAQKLAFQDRKQFLGDPDFTKVPTEKLLSKEFAKERSDTIHFETAIPTPEAAMRPLALEAANTSHLSIVDEQGNCAAYTTTIEEIFGSAMVVPGRGFFLNNELTDFEEFPKDQSGKIAPNAPQANKRPRSSMTPALVFREGKPAAILGSPGGSKIIGTVLNVMVNLIDFRMPLEEAVDALRIINRGGSVEAEPGIFSELPTLKRELERRGHPVTELKQPIGNVQAVYFDSDNDLIRGEADPRGEGKADGY